MKNKTKAWRRKAATINKLEGKKHCGRAYRNLVKYMETPKTPYPLLNSLLVKAGIIQEEQKTIVIDQV